MSTNDSSSAKKVSSSVVLIVVGLVMLIFRIYLLGIVLPLMGVVRTAKWCKTVSVRKLYQIPLFLVIAVLALVPIVGSIIGAVQLNTKPNVSEIPLNAPSIQAETDQNARQSQDEVTIPVDIPAPQTFDGYGDDVLSIKTLDYSYSHDV